MKMALSIVALSATAYFLGRGIHSALGVDEEFAFSLALCWLLAAGHFLENEGKKAAYRRRLSKENEP